MSRQAISVTLDADNVTWLRGRVRAAGARSLSDLIDRLVTSARESGEVGPSRSVAGTIDVDAADPLLKRADAAVRDFEGSIEIDPNNADSHIALAEVLDFKGEKERGITHLVRAIEIDPKNPEPHTRLMYLYSSTCMCPPS